MTIKLDKPSFSVQYKELLSEDQGTSERSERVSLKY